MRHRKAIATEVFNRYIKATKKDKSKILDEFSATTGYNRIYAASNTETCSWKSNGIYKNISKFINQYREGVKA